MFQVNLAEPYNHKHTHGFGIRLSCKVATRFCQILCNLLSCQVVFMACDNRYGDMSPCFIAGSLVVNSYVSEVICVHAMRVDRACSIVVEVRFFNAWLLFLYTGLKCKLLGFYYYRRFFFPICRYSYYLGNLSYNRVGVIVLYTACVLPHLPSEVCFELLGRHIPCLQWFQFVLCLVIIF